MEKPEWYFVPSVVVAILVVGVVVASNASFLFIDDESENIS